MNAVYKDKVKEAMSWITTQKGAVFLGEGLINAGRVYGTMKPVPLKRCIEMPIAENLIAGSAIGLALRGYRPVIVFQRMDFMLIAADAIINHMALMPKMSGGQFKLPILIRCIVGSQDTKFDVGAQHNHDFTHIFYPYVKTIELVRTNAIYRKYQEAFLSDEPVILVEYKDMYKYERILSMKREEL